MKQVETGSDALEQSADPTPQELAESASCDGLRPALNRVQITEHTCRAIQAAPQAPKSHGFAAEAGDAALGFSFNVARLCSRIFGSTRLADNWPLNATRISGSSMRRPESFCCTTHIPFRPPGRITSAGTDPTKPSIEKPQRKLD